MEFTDKAEILLVEDSASDIELIMKALDTNNIAERAFTVRDGEEALEYIFATGKYSGRDKEDLPNVILLDLRLPKINGIEVLRRLKTDERTKSIPVVILTSSSEDPDINECYKIGANSYIIKPIVYEKFINAISQVTFYWFLLNQHKR